MDTLDTERIRIAANLDHAADAFEHESQQDLWSTTRIAPGLASTARQLHYLARRTLDPTEPLDVLEAYVDAALGTLKATRSARAFLECLGNGNAL